MSQRFDIFCFQVSALRWLTAVDTLEDAKAHIEKLPESASGRYGVLDQRTGEMLSFHFQHVLGGGSLTPVDRSAKKAQTATLSGA
jgi:hypothetical protein